MRSKLEKLKIKNKIISLLPDITLISAMVILLTFIFVSYFAIFGVLSFEHDFSAPDPYINYFWPDTKLNTVCKNFKCYQEINADEIYFNVNLPRYFYEAEIELQYKTDNQNIIEFGVADFNSVEYFPVQNKLLEQKIFSTDHRIIHDDDIYLIQKKNKYNSIVDFFKNVPNESKIGAYNIEINNSLIPQEKYFEKPYIQGSVDLFLYTNSQASSHMNLEFADLNKNPESDDISIYVFDESNNIVYKKHIKDSNNYQNLNEFNYEFKSPSLNTGVYRMEIRTTDDIILKNVESFFVKTSYAGEVKYLAKKDINKYWPNENIEALTIYSKSRNLVFSAINGNGLQNIKINNENINLKNVEKQYTYNTDDINVYELKIPDRGIIITSSGYQSFSKEQLIDNNIIDISNINEREYDNVNYILARYNTPEKKEDGWYKQKLNIKLSPNNYKNNNVTFVFKSPGLEKNNGKLYVSAMKFSLYTNPISTKSLVKKISEFYSKFKQNTFVFLTK